MRPVLRLEESVGGPARWHMIVLFGSVLGLQAADTGALGALAAPLEKAFHIGNTDIGLLVTVTTLVGCVATLPFGSISDRYSRTRLLQVVVALWALATFISALSVSFAMLLVSRLALGGVIAAAGPALASLFGDLVAPEERSRLWSYVLAGELIGAGFGILVAGGLSGVTDWRIAMGVLALPALALSWALRRYLPEPPRGGMARLQVGDEEILSVADVGAESTGDTHPDEEVLPEPSVIEIQAEEAGVRADPDLVLSGEPDMRFWQAALFVLRIRANVALIVASGFGYFFLAGLETFAELYFRERYGVGQSLAAVLFIVVAVGAVVGVVVSGRLTDTLIRRGYTPARMMVGAVAYAVSVVAFVPGALGTKLVVSMPVFFLAAAFIGATNPPVDAARLDIIPARLWGRAESVRTALRQILQGLAPLMFGLVSEAFGGGAAGLSTGVDTGATRVSGAAAHGLQMAFIWLSAPLLVSGVVLWLHRTDYLREVVSARRSDEGTVARAAAAK